MVAPSPPAAIDFTAPAAWGSRTATPLPPSPLRMAMPPSDRPRWSVVPRFSTMVAGTDSGSAADAVTFGTSFETDATASGDGDGAAGEAVGRGEGVAVGAGVGIGGAGVGAAGVAGGGDGEKTGAGVDGGGVGVGVVPCPLAARRRAGAV